MTIEEGQLSAEALIRQRFADAGIRLENLD
jgi:hypothetical protein